ncbi:LOW QUALITY PROTEIN: aspartic proteinase-like protein 2 [Phalaenopsis equestris]|uniref:LOW QUALITY PROTEIN: aspartic proteinase-like protein 2 n=1 Tax=Phalaenopsis equestris TaxID=78828 RepID=UPI0009E60B12|nr:LOW QUALITY PROTEIN: aspartic proteinase-like protein 2 [Phalaenopsis equestris]
MAAAAVNGVFAGAVIAVLVVIRAAAWNDGSQLTMVLERGMPTKAPVEVLRARDRFRHRRILQGAAAPSYGVVDFPVEGSWNPFTVGLYFTRVKLGNPAKEFYAKEFYVQKIDTGSDILWVTCNPCTGCPTSSGLNIKLESFEPDQSSTSSTLSCSDQRCSSAIQTGEATCSSSDSSSSSCSYSFQYGDGSGTSGYYVSDTLHFDIVTGNEQRLNSSATILFGCSNSQSGDLTKSDRAIDGIYGFGQHELSVISQLSSAGVAPKVFSHCLKGSDNGGGILVLGEIVEPGIVYTPLVQSKPHYNLNLESISVNGQTLSIDSSVFTTSNTQGTIVDSGTTLAYLAEKAYDPFVNAIVASVSQTLVNSFVAKGNQCFLTASRVDDVFPPVSLNFMGNASMILKPEDYLFQQGSAGNGIIWCIGWQKSDGEGITILGDIILKDKVVVYDLANQRIGWTSYDCSQPVNVSTSSGKNEYLNSNQLDTSASGKYPKLLLLSSVATVVHILVAAALLS